MCEAKTAGPTVPGAAPRENQPTVAASGGTCRVRSSLKPSFMIEWRVTPMAGTSIPVGADDASGRTAVGASAGVATVAGPVRAEPGPCPPPDTTATRATPASSTTITVVRTEVTRPVRSAPRSRVPDGMSALLGGQQVVVGHIVPGVLGLLAAGDAGTGDGRQREPTQRRRDPRVDGGRGGTGRDGTDRVAGGILAHRPVVALVAVARDAVVVPVEVVRVGAVVGEDRLGLVVGELAAVEVVERRGQVAPRGVDRVGVGARRGRRRGGLERVEQVGQ